MSEKIWNDSDKYIEILTRNTVLIADSDFSHSAEIRFHDMSLDIEIADDYF